MKKFLVLSLMLFFSCVGMAFACDENPGILSFIGQHELASVVCAKGVAYYSNGKYAGTAGGEWYYPNGAFAGQKGKTWFYPTGNLAGSGSEKGTWYHPNGKLAGTKGGEWYYSNGTYAGKLF